MGNVIHGEWSLAAARHNFAQWVLPRRARDIYAEMLYFHKNGENQKVYRYGAARIIFMFVCMYVYYYYYYYYLR